MLSFLRAFELGCDMVECDVRLSADGVAVLAHDSFVTDAGGTHYDIRATGAKTLASLDLGSGEGVPGLDQLVAWAAGRCAVMADMKCETDMIETQVCELLRPLPNSMKIVPGAGSESRQRFRKADASLPLSLSLDAEIGEQLQLNFNLYTLLDSIDTEAVTWQYPLLNEATVSALKGRGFTVYAWTVDDMDVAARLIGYGVDGIISNRADMLAGLYSDSARG
jgi:glycerophosphoryl diester phosphodiesterase